MFKFKRELLLAVLLILTLGVAYFTYPLRRIERFSHLHGSDPDYFSLAYQDDILYVFSRHNEILVFDIENPKKLELLGIVDFPYNLERATGITVNGDFVYVVSNSDELIVVDVSDLKTTRVIGRYSPSVNDSFSMSMLIENDVGYLMENDIWETGSPNYQFLHILDIGAPETIVEYSMITDGGIPLEIANEKILFVESPNTTHSTNYLSYIKVIDVSNPVEPHIVVDLVEYQSPTAVAVDKNSVYIGANGRFYVTETEDFENYVVLGMLPDEQVIRGIIPVGDYVFYWNFYRVGVIDVSNPSTPKIIGSRRLSTGRDFIFKEGYIFVADDTGLYVYETELLLNDFLNDIRDIIFSLTY